MTKFQMSKLKAFRLQNICDRRGENSFGQDRKHCWNRRKCWLPAFSPFPTMISKVFSYRVIKSC